MIKRLNIAIVGAGIGGLSAASLLTDSGHTVVIFDQFSETLPVGSGLVIQPVGQDVLAQIGVIDAALATGNRVNRMLGHDAGNGRRVLDVWYGHDQNSRFGLAIHRSALFQALFDAVTSRGVHIITDAQVTSADNGTVTLANGQRHGPFDLVVDASGAGSALSPLVSRPLPYGAIWGTVNWPQDTDLRVDWLHQVYRRADRMLGVLPIGKPHANSPAKAAIFWSMPRDSHGTWCDRGLVDWRQQTHALWPEFAPFINQITESNQMTMARYGHATLGTPYGKKIAHIGDAAHRASPQLGQGANMALLDALALSRALDRVDVSQALQLYARARRWHVRIYQMMSWVFTPQYQSDSRFLPFLRDRIIFPASMVPPIPRLLTRLVRGDMVPPLGSLK
ncbi:MAG: NAD(P)/FAD-dependent oxidoreductase [Rhodobacterales bacterium]|nr:NAD(P)/FAD-dependent oxidoreductase [Rhodobacterales bacterium]